MDISWWDGPVCAKIPLHERRSTLGQYFFLEIESWDKIRIVTLAYHYSVHASHVNRIDWKTKFNATENKQRILWFPIFVESNHPKNRLVVKYNGWHCYVLNYTYNSMINFLKFSLRMEDLMLYSDQRNNFKNSIHMLGVEWNFFSVSVNLKTKNAIFFLH